MSGIFNSSAPEEPLRRSRRVGLVLLGSAGAVVAGVAWSAWQQDPDDDWNQPSVPPVTVQDGGTYSNNHYVPGGGYYHAPYHSWFPFPYNYHDSARGYYHGGQWTAQPEASGLTATHPTPTAVRSINAAARSASRGIVRGGFGSSAHASGSGA